jgi:translation initiation factor 2 alpha subunit (eIF-2alpha)
MVQKLEEGDLVLCTVEKIIGTIVFVRIHFENEEKEGSIILSEIAPGRIRNIRDYVVPKKKIVCKILRISGDKIDLSLRRVNQKERKEVIELYNKEKSYESVLKSILKEKAEKIISDITKDRKISDFLEEAKKDPKELEKVCGKLEAEKIFKILKKEKKKNATLKREIKLISTNSNGLELIKKILEKAEKENSEIKYISAGTYSIKTEAENIKTADKKLKEIIKNIEKDAKKENMDFEIKEKRK